MDLKEKRLKLTARRIEALNSLGIYDTDALFSYYPYRYEVMEEKPFEQWQIKDKVTFEAEVVSTVRTWRHGRMTTSSFDVMAFDRVLKITIFNHPWAKNLALNQIVTIQGVYQGKNKVTAMTYDNKRMKDHDAVTPVYSTKEGIQQRTIRDSIRKVYEELQNEIPDIIPEMIFAAQTKGTMPDTTPRTASTTDKSSLPCSGLAISQILAMGFDFFSFKLNAPPIS
jgi:ATP-dependent DNA helicase RecG